MRRNAVAISSLAISGVLFCALGIFILVASHLFLWALYRCTAIVFVTVGVLQIVGCLSHKMEREDFFHDIIAGLVNIALAVLVWIFPNLYLTLFPLVMGLYLLFQFALKSVTFVLYCKNNVPGRFFTLLSGIILLVIGILFLTSPYTHILTLTTTVGIYMILYSTTFFSDLIKELFPQKAASCPSKRRFRIPLPVFIAAFLPSRALAILDKRSREPSGESLELDIRKGDLPPQLEVFIPTGKKGSTVLGHVDLCLDGKVYSYGCYDESTMRLGGGLGEGTLFTCENKEDYLQFACHHSQKTIFGFGLLLNQDQKDRVEEKIREIFSVLYPWHCAAQELSESDPQAAAAADDYASCLYRATKAKFYKFRSGPFKTYFVMSTNCVLLADQVIGAAGTNLLSIGGFVSPGTYYDYLYREFQKSNSMVVQRTIYVDEQSDSPLSRRFRRQRRAAGKNTRRRFSS